MVHFCFSKISFPDDLSIETVLVELGRGSGRAQAEELVVTESDVGVRKHLVGLVDLLELVVSALVLLRGLPLTLKDVWMMLFRLSEELLLDFLGRRLPTHTQN